MNLKKLKNVGKELKEHRKTMGLTLQGLSNELKIRRQYLESIEKGQRSVLPSETYIIGYVKQYAKRLGLDPKIFINQLSEKSTDKKLSSGASENLITPKEFLPDVKLVIITFILFILSYLLISWWL